MLIALILSLALSLAQDPPEQQIVQAGHAAVDTLAADAETRLTMQVDEPGAVTLSLESFIFDPVISVVDGQGRVIATDNDTGTGWGAWLTLDVKPFVTYQIVVSSHSEGRGGPYHLAVLGEAADPPHETGSQGLARIYALFAEHERAEGKLSTTRKLYLTSGEEMFRRAEFHLAASAFREVLKINEELPDPVMELLYGAHLGACERRIGDTGLAIELLETAWANRAVLARADVDCFILENLGEAHYARHDLDAALEYFDAWAETSATAGLSSFEALAHTRRGRMYARKGDLVAAGEAHDRAVALLHSFDEPYYAAQILVAAGRYLELIDRYDDAASILERAALLTAEPETAHLINWEVTLEIQIALGDVQAERGRHGFAQQCLERATRLLGNREDRHFELDLQIAMAELAASTGDLVRAIELTHDCIELARERDDLPLRVDLTRFLGALQEQSGDLFAADRTYEQAHGLCGGLERPDKEWLVLFAHGRLSRKQDRYMKALDLYGRALDLADTLEEEPSARAHCLNGISYTLTFMGEHESAREGALAALAIWEEAGAPDQALVGPLHTLAVIALASGQLDEVDRLLARADEIINREDVTGLDRMDAAGVRSGFVDWGELAQDLVAQRLDQPDADRSALIAQGYTRAGAWKARALLEGMPVPEGPVNRVDVLRSALGDGRALVEYARGADSLYAYVLDSRELRLLALGSATDLDAQVDAFMDGITQIDRLAPADEIAELGGALHQFMLAPVLAVLEDVDGLVIVPTPTLARLPFEALVISADASRGTRLGFDDIEFLADRYHVTYGPSSPVLARLGALGPRRTPGRALVMGDPWYASEEGEVGGSATARDPRSSSRLSYERLLATKAEVLNIAEALLLAGDEEDDEVQRDLLKLAKLKHERSGGLESRQFDLYVGEDASSDRLKGDLREYDVLHIAAHGEVDPEDPMRTGLILSFDGEVHGYLTLMDILELQLDANMVVLSACETASGRILKGEGVQSMAQAFLQAGSRAVVASLWSVDDSATREIMSSFYESVLIGKRSGAEALRDAKALRQLKQNVRNYGSARGPAPDPAPGDALNRPLTDTVGHPYYWAPFIYVGAVP